jgi:hypothetical protein
MNMNTESLTNNFATLISTLKHHEYSLLRSYQTEKKFEKLFATKTEVEEVD